MKKNRSFVGVTPYALLLYLIITDEEDLSKTTYYVGHGLWDCVLPKMVKIPEVLPYTSSNLIKNRILYFLKYRNNLKKSKIFAQDHLTFSAPLIDNLPYSVLEDCPNFFSVMVSRTPRIPPFVPGIRSFWHNFKVGRIYDRYGGFNPWCINRIVTTNSDVATFRRLNLNCEFVDLETKWKESSSSKKKFIQKTFSFSDSESFKKRKVVIFSQPLMGDAHLSEDDFISIYKPYIDKYGAENILVKLHPRDNFDYVKHFPEIAILKTKAPQQLLSLIGIRFSTAITVCSSAVSSMDEDCEIVWIGAEVDDRIVQAYGHVKSPSNYK